MNKSMNNESVNEFNGKKKRVRKSIATIREIKNEHKDVYNFKNSSSDEDRKMVIESLNLPIESTKPTILPLSSKAIKNINVKKEVIDQPQKLKKKYATNDEHNSQLKTKKLKIENEENFDIEEIETAIAKLEYSKLNEINKSLIIREKICYICETNEDLINCQGTCHQSAHANCIGLLNVTNGGFKCKECSSGLHDCFICKKSSVISENSVTKKCSLNKCSRYYHEGCIKMNELFYKDSLSNYVCPLHTCVTCWSETSKFAPDYDQNEMTSILQPSKGDLYQCIKCPTAYHTGDFCLAAGSLILDGLNIICPKHFQPIKSISQHIRINVNWCFVCCINGDLIGCISCPASYHLKCINNPPSSLISLLKKEEDESLKPNSPPVSSTESLLNQYSPSSSACSSSIASSSNSYVNTSLNWECEDCVIGKRPVTGEVVWSKAGPYRWWPAEICSLDNLPENLQNKTFQVGEYPVRFFGTNDYYWANIGRCFAFHENDEQFMKQSQLKTGNNKSKSLTVAFNDGVNRAIIAFNHIKKLKLERVNRLAVQFEDQIKFSKKNIQNYNYIKTNRPVGDVTIQKKPISELPFCSCDSKEPNPCGTDNCLNRILKYECHPTLCPAGERCQNQRFVKRIYPKQVPFNTGSRGTGLKTLVDIKKGDFVNEYVGEIIDENECKRRIELAHKNDCRNFYFLTIDKERTIDAGPKGNLCRFMNHCCDPNCETQKWMVNGDIRVGLFALSDIAAMTELTFNYNLDCLSNEKAACKCGATNCSGFIGERPKNSNISLENKVLKAITSNSSTSNALLKNTLDQVSSSNKKNLKRKFIETHDSEKTKMRSKSANPKIATLKITKAKELKMDKLETESNASSTSSIRSDKKKNKV